MSIHLARLMKKKGLLIILGMAVIGVVFYYLYLTPQTYQLIPTENINWGNIKDATLTDGHVRVIVSVERSIYGPIKSGSCWLEGVSDGWVSSAVTMIIGGGGISCYVDAYFYLVINQEYKVRLQIVSLDSYGEDYTDTFTARFILNDPNFDPTTTTTTTEPITTATTTTTTTGENVDDANGKFGVFGFEFSLLLFILIAFALKRRTRENE